MKKLLAFALVLGFSSQVMGFNVGDFVEGPLEIKTVTQDGTVIEKTNMLVGKTENDFVVLEFAQTTCGWCVKNLPNMAVLADVTKTVATVKYILIDRAEASSMKFIEKYRTSLTFDVGLDTSRVVFKTFKASSTPTLFILSSKREVIYKHVRLLEAKDFEEIKNLLGL